MNKTTRNIIGGVLLTIGIIFFLINFVYLLAYIQSYFKDWTAFNRDYGEIMGPMQSIVMENILRTALYCAISLGFIIAGMFVINGPGAFSWLRNLKIPSINLPGQEKAKSNDFFKAVSGQLKTDDSASKASSSNINFAPRQSPINKKPVSGALQTDGIIPIPVIVGLGDKPTGLVAKAKLAIVQDGGVKHEFLLSQDNMIIGRWDADGGAFPEIDLTQYDSDSFVSRKHARISISNDGFFIEDLGSANGTFVNRGGRIVPGKPEKLSNGCEIVVGKTFLKFHIL